jgi:hypothetical protein
MIRSLKYFIGQTPSQIIRDSKHMQLSFLYNTIPFGRPKITDEEQREQNYYFINRDGAAAISAREKVANPM